ncbi:hypothetical protein AALA36_09070 [Lachnospiraceae bacterium 66-29]
MTIRKENLVMQLQLHHEKALEVLLAEHGERLLSIIRKHLFTLPHLQQDCLVDVIQSIWDYIDCFDKENEFENWIGSVARYRCLEFLKLHRNEATIAWLIEKEIAEEEEVMVSCLEPDEQKLFFRFYREEELLQDASLTYRNMYELLNCIDTDICEYEKEPHCIKKWDEILRRIQIRKKEKRHRFSFLKYLGYSFGRMLAINIEL